MSLVRDLTTSLLIADLTRLTQEAIKLGVELREIPTDSPQKERQSAKTRSSVAIKILEARNILERIWELDSGSKLAVEAALTLLETLIQADLPAEAWHLLRHYSQDPEFRQMVSGPLLRRLQSSIAIAFFKVNAPQKAEEVFQEMAPPDHSEESRVIFSQLYICFISLYQRVTPWKADQIYNAFLALFPEAKKGWPDQPPTPDSPLPPPNSQALSDQELNDLISEDSPLEKPLEKVLKEILAKGAKPGLSLDQPQAWTLAEEYLAQAALLMVRSLANRGLWGRLPELWRTLAHWPETEPYLTHKSSLLVEILNSLDSSRHRQLAEDFLAKLLTLPDNPAVVEHKAKGILATLFFHQDDPNLIRARELVAILEDLPSLSDKDLTRLKAWAVMVSFCCAHGQLIQALNFCQKKLSEANTTQEEEVIAHVLYALLTAWLAAGQSEKAMETLEMLIQLGSSPQVNKQKARAALLMISQSALMRDPDLAVRIFHNLTKIGEASGYSSQLTHALSALLRSLARDGRRDQMELYLKVMDSLEDTDDNLTAVKADLRIELVKNYLAHGDSVKARGLARKIENAPDSPSLHAEKARLRLVIIQSLGATGELKKAQENFEALKALDSQQSTVLSCQAQALVSLAAMAAAQKLWPEVLARHQELSALADHIWPSVVAPLKMSLTVLVILVSLSQGQDELAREMLSSLLGAPQPNGDSDLPLLATEMVAATLVAQDAIPEAQALGQKLAPWGDEFFLSLVAAKIHLLAIKRLVSLKRMPQAEPYLRELLKLRPAGGILEIQVEALLVISKAYAQAGLFFGKFQLAKPPRPTARRSRKPSQTEELDQTNRGLYWLEKMLSLPDLESVKIGRKKAAHHLVIALIGKNQPYEALRVFRLFPQPLPTDGYDIVKTHLNSSLALIEAYLTVDPAVSLTLAQDNLTRSLREFLAKYYLRELGRLYQAAQKMERPDLSIFLADYGEAMSEPLAQSYLKPRLKATPPDPA
ncbi:MAG: hypothetical protein LBR11_10355 [Deltaproteobacteria bacterium]|jgi:tetratricopeptide (TPR) repeat protein|nr:hypothetical protein [Deltaproteobacteria bacterium]